MCVPKEKMSKDGPSNINIDIFQTQGTVTSRKRSRFHAPILFGPSRYVYMYVHKRQGGLNG